MTLVRTSVRLALGTLMFGAFAAAGCSNDEQTTPPIDPLANETGFCQALAEAVCNATLVTECYGSVGSTLTEDTQNCQVAARTNFCNPDNLVYRNINAQLCIDTYRGAYADAAIQLTELEAIADACHATLSGNAKQGDACETTTDCNGSAGLECLAKPGGTGSCQTPEVVMPGTDCAGAAQTCTEGFYCSVEAEACIQEQEVGDACSETEPCDKESRCVSESCVARQSNGQDCMVADECSGGFCDIASGETQGTCKAAQPINSTNGTCDAFLP